MTNNKCPGFFLWEKQQQQQQQQRQRQTNKQTTKQAVNKTKYECHLRLK